MDRLQRPLGMYTYGMSQDLLENMTPPPHPPGNHGRYIRQPICRVEPPNSRPFDVLLVHSKIERNPERNGKLPGCMVVSSRGFDKGYLCFVFDSISLSPLLLSLNFENKTMR